MIENYLSRPHSKTCSSSMAGKSAHGGGHKPVLLAEVIENLAIKKAGVYVDATFGYGGHAYKILQYLNEKGRLFAIDKDPAAVDAAKLLRDKRLCVRKGSFTVLKDWMIELGLCGKVDGILLDLGVSSPQLETIERGFSFLKDGPLDMRMDPTKGIDAATWINSANQEEIAKVLKIYGEEKFSKKIAKAIVHARKIAPIATTKQLANLVIKANPKWERHKHPATRVFQAIRIFINNELEELKICLEQCLSVLAIGGRLAVISFHSLEDRIVKQFIRKHSKGEDIPREIPIKHTQLAIRLKSIHKVIKPTVTELIENPRARSAVLRVAEKLL